VAVHCGFWHAAEAEARLRRFDGECRWFLFRANPLRDESGDVVKWFGVSKTTKRTTLSRREVVVWSSAALLNDQAGFELGISGSR
jgi:PAS domain-containing protein